MGHVFQAEWWGKHPNGCLFGLLWLRKLENEVEKALERHEEFIIILFMKII